MNPIIDLAFLEEKEEDIQWVSVTTLPNYVPVTPSVPYYMLRETLASKQGLPINWDLFTDSDIHFRLLSAVNGSLFQDLYEDLHFDGDDFCYFDNLSRQRGPASAETIIYGKNPDATLQYVHWIECHRVERVLSNVDNRIFGMLYGSHWIFSKTGRFRLPNFTTNRAINKWIQDGFWDDVSSMIVTLKSYRRRRFIMLHHIEAGDLNKLHFYCDTLERAEKCYELYCVFIDFIIRRIEFVEGKTSVSPGVWGQDNFKNYLDLDN